MYEKTTNYFCLMVQRYEEQPTRENLFNESAHIFSQAGYLYFVSMRLCFVSIFLTHGMSSMLHQ